MEPNGYIQGLTASLELSTSTPVPSRTILKGPIGSVTNTHRVCDPQGPPSKGKAPYPQPQCLSGSDLQPPPNSRPLKNKPLISVWLQPFCWEVGAGKEGRGWGSNGGSQGSREKRDKQLDPQAPPSRGRTTECLLFVGTSQFAKPPCQSSPQPGAGGLGGGFRAT